MTFNSFNRKYPAVVTYISFCVPFFSIVSLNSYLNMYLFFYLQVYIGISAVLIFLPISIVNLAIPFLQPLLGSISDRNFPFTRNLGRRFFWILVMGFQIPIFFVLVFWVPFSSGMMFVVVFTALLLLYNIAYSAFLTSYSALLLNKFRNPKERLLLGTVTEFISTFGLIIISFIAPMFISYGDASSIQFLTIPIAITFVATLLLGIFGILEEKELIDTYFSPNLAPKNGLLKDMFKGFAIFKRKNFLVLLFRWIAFALFNLLFSSSLAYYFIDVLGASIYLMSIAYMGYYIWLLIALPISFLLSWFIGHLRVSIISGFALGVTLLVFSFVANYLMAVILVSIIGFCLGLGMASLIPLVGDVFDEHANINRKRSEGVSYGILKMFGSLTVILSSVITAVVQSITGFIPWGPQTPLALVGIRLLISIIPGIIIIGVMIIFVVSYDLKPKKTEAIRMELKELEI